MKEIKNIEEITAKLAEMLKQFDIELNRYQTDVYLYIDENGTATLDTFVNVGGNSWINDDHYTLYRDKEHFDTIYDTFTTVAELADAAGIDMQTIEHKFGDCADWADVRDFIRENEEYAENVECAYIDCLPDSGEYDEIADSIIQGFIREQNEIEKNVCRL